MPPVRRAIVFLFCGLVSVAGIAGCGSSHAAAANDFCAAIQRRHSAFDSSDPADSVAGLAEFDRVAALAPPAVAPDLKTVSAVLHAAQHDPKALTKSPSVLTKYFASIVHIDDYLHNICGLQVPRRVNL